MGIGREEEDKEMNIQDMIQVGVKRRGDTYQGFLEVKHPDLNKKWTKIISVCRICYDHALQDAEKLKQDYVDINQLP
jgi:uncharacterized protein YqeY